jgi:plasmid stabilization system protein ParE
MRIVWSMRAEDQLDQHVANLKDRVSTAAAKRMVMRILDRLEDVAELPRSAPRWTSGPDPTFRRLVVGEFVVIYRVDEDNQQIQVLSLRHGRQRPPDPEEVGDP